MVDLTHGWLEDELDDDLVKGFSDLFNGVGLGDVCFNSVEPVVGLLVGELAESCFNSVELVGNFLGGVELGDSCFNSVDIVGF